MAVPDFQSFFNPLLDVAVDGKEHSMKEAREIIARSIDPKRIVQWKEQWNILKLFESESLTAKDNQES